MERRQRLSLRSRRALPAPPHAGESRSHLGAAQTHSRGLIPPPPAAGAAGESQRGCRVEGQEGRRTGRSVHIHTHRHTRTRQAAAPDRLLFAGRSAGSRALNKTSRSISRADLLPRESP